MDTVIKNIMIGVSLGLLTILKYLEKELAEMPIAKSISIHRLDGVIKTKSFPLDFYKNF